MLVDSVLIGFNNPRATKIESETQTVNSMSGGYGEYYTIPTVVFNALKKAVIVVEEAAKEIREQRDAAFIAARTQVEKERDRIYNEGIAYGRNLLAQLNTGEITLEEINKNRSYK